MSKLQFTGRLAIHPGKLSDFKEQAAQCMRLVREKDSGCLHYDWFINDEQTVCMVRETYRDSAAVLEHMSNLGDTLGTLLGVCDLTVEVFGTPSSEIVAALKDFSPITYSPYQSI